MSHIRRTPVVLLLFATLLFALAGVFVSPAVAVLSVPCSTNCGPTSESPVSVNCGTTSIAEGSSTTCSGGAGCGECLGSAATMTFSDSGTGAVSFSSESCMIEGLMDDVCTATVTGTVAGSVTITISYPSVELTTGTASMTVVGTAPSGEPTATSVACTTYSILIGDTSTCTADVSLSVDGETVTMSASGSGAVSFSATTCSLSGGTCSVTVQGTGAGSVNVLASYPGDSAYAASSGSSQAIAVSKSATTTAVACTTYSLAVSDSTTCTATLSGFSGSTDGEAVSWYQSGTGGISFSAATCSLSSGSCGVMVTGATSGGLTVEAFFPGDAANAVSYAYAGFTVTGAASSSETSVTCDPTSFAAGSSGTTCTATVTGSTPTGTVDWSQLVGTVPVFVSSETCTLSSGACSIAVTGSAAGTATMEADYQGDTNNPKSSGFADLVIDPVTPDIGVSCDTYSISVLGTGATCTATVSNYYGSIDGETIYWEVLPLIGNGYISPDTATCALSTTMSVTSCQVTFYGTESGVPNGAEVFPKYQGDAANAEAGAISSPISIGEAQSSTSVTCLPSTITVGHSTTCTATVTTYFGSIDGETVTWYPIGSPGDFQQEFSSFPESPGPFPTCALSTTDYVTGCSITITSTGPGSATIEGQYAGEGGINYGSEGQATITVISAVPTLTTSVYDSAASGPWSSTEVTGASAYDTATVTGGTSLTPTGTVTYDLYSGAACSGSAITTQTVTMSGGLVPNSTSTAALGAGAYGYGVSYSGDNNYQSVSSCESFTVSQAAATIATTVSPSTIPALGETVSDTAEATGVAGFTPTGTVKITLYRGGSCGGAVLAAYLDVALGTPRSIPDQPAGLYSFRASAYSGDANYLPGSRGGCEPFEVLRAQAGVSTAIEPGASVIFGTPTYDAATIGGTVAGFVPTGTVTYGFYTGSMCSGLPSLQTVLLSGGSVPYSGSRRLTPGAYSYRATYSGDSNYLEATSGCEQLAVQTPTTVLVACLPPVSVPGVQESCTVSVTNNDPFYDARPSGTVTLTGTLPAGMPTSCILSAGSGVANLCAVSWIPGAGTEGSYSIAASYGGDATHSPGSAHTSLNIVKRSVSVSLSCSGSFTRNTPVKCTVTVVDNSPGLPFALTGTVALSSSGPGVFSSPSCTYAGPKETCSVTFTPTTLGLYTVVASYGGDPNHYAGVSSTTFRVS